MSEMSSALNSKKELTSEEPRGNGQKKIIFLMLKEYYSLVEEKSFHNQKY